LQNPFAFLNRNPAAAWNDAIVLVTACDENYALGAAAAIRSAIDSVGSQQRIRVFVLDGGITRATKWWLRRSWRGRNVAVGWLTPNLQAIGDLPVSGHINLSTYLRLLLAELLPADVEKAIYLDADTIVLRDISELWATPVNDFYCAATQDAFVPVLNPHEAFSHPIHSMTIPNMSPYPIPNYRELGLAGTAPYFNAGILLVNVAKWRREQVARRALECLRANGDAVRFWDQYALNTLFSGNWKIVDPRWNQNTHVFRIPHWELSHYSEDEFSRVREDPWIVHFDYKPKPWVRDCAHPFREAFFQALDRTAWRSWRPGSSMQERMQENADYLRKYSDDLVKRYRQWRRTRFSPTVRAWKDRLLRRKRKAA